MKLAGKVAIVTRAGSGIGRACAERFARESAAVVLAGQLPQAVARLALFLASEDSSWITGAAIALDGGFTAY